jgi:hypothetical protein
MATLKNRFQVFIVMALILVSTPSCFNNKKISNALKDEIRDSLKVELQKFFDNQSSEDEVAQKLRRKRAIFVAYMCSEKIKFCTTYSKSFDWSRRIYDEH